MELDVEKLLAEHENDMYRIAYLYVKNTADALDVVQDAAFRAYTGIKSLKEPRYFKTWLTRIVINCSIDRIRRDGKYVLTEPERMEQECLAEESAVLDRLSLDGLMNALDEWEKQVVIMKYYCDNSFQEIARELGRPEGTIKTVLYRALRKLRARAKEEGLYE